MRSQAGGRGARRRRWRRRGTASLLGGVAGFKFGRNVLAGAFGGLESTPYIARLDGKYYKAGAFVRWLGTQGRTIGLTFSQLMYDGSVERRFVYASLFLPVRRVLVLYGDTEYEPGDHVSGEDRLSRLFGNIRLDLGRMARRDRELKLGQRARFPPVPSRGVARPVPFQPGRRRFYYSSYYGVRFSFKPVRTLRLSVARQESRQNDLGIVNHTWRFGAAASNILDRGLSFVGNYALNRGDRSESDSYYADLTKDFGRFSLNGSFSNTFRGVRFDQATGEPVPVAVDDYQNVAIGAIIRFGRDLSAQIEYGGFLQPGENEHFVFFRWIYSIFAVGPPRSEITPVNPGTASRMVSTHSESTSRNAFG